MTSPLSSPVLASKTKGMLTASQDNIWDTGFYLKMYIFFLASNSSGYQWIQNGSLELWVKNLFRSINRFALLPCDPTVVLRKTLESPLNCKEIQPVHPKRNQSWVFISIKTDAEAETPIFWSPDAKNWLIGKDPDAGKNWRPEEKGTREGEMAGWHHWLNGHEFEWTPGVGDGQGCLVYCSPWGSQRVRHDWGTELNWSNLILCKPPKCILSSTAGTFYEFVLRSWAPNIIPQNLLLNWLTHCSMVNLYQWCECMYAKSRQSCLTLCDPMD